MIDTKANKRKFDTILSTVDREGIGDLLAWMETTDAYVAPASTKYHLSVRGGLVQHSLNVYYTLVRICDTYDVYDDTLTIPSINDDTLVITALCHDLCKIDTYVTETKWHKPHGSWASYEAYRVSDTMPMGHSPKSVYILNRFIDLSDEEAMSVLWHMGRPTEYADQQSYYSACKMYPLVTMLHCADLIATSVLEEDHGSN